jgi:hypothetical protein
MVLWADMSVDITGEVIKQLAPAASPKPGFN